MNRRAAQERPSNHSRDWWLDMQARSDAGCGSDEGKRIDTNIVSWQDAGGGWLLMQTIDESPTANDGVVGPWGRRGALMKATVNEIRYLARAHRVTNDAQYLRAAKDGFDFILRAQYPSGGWPHSFPYLRNPYDRYATFNDDEMPDLMRLLREVVTEPDFEAFSAERRAAAQAAFDKGLEFILKSQVIVQGEPTAWCQQHDEVTLEPRSARAFEPVALSGGESAGVLTLLMSIEQPSAAVVRAIEAGVAWYEAVKITGIRLERTADDRIVREDPNASPMWARFYEIGTNRPIFAGRDGVVRYQMAEIEKERRDGYAWYGYWGKDVLERYSVWRRARVPSPTAP